METEINEQVKLLRKGTSYLSLKEDLEDKYEKSVAISIAQESFKRFTAAKIRKNIIGGLVSIVIAHIYAFYAYLNQQPLSEFYWLTSILGVFLLAFGLYHYSKMRKNSF